MVYLKDDPESSEAVLYFLRLTSRYAMLASYSRTMFSSNTSIQNSQARVSRNKVEQFNPQLRSLAERIWLMAEKGLCIYQYKMINVMIVR